jgi:CRP-like cAMP-binding protein
MMQVEPIKRFENMSAIYFLCQRMTLAKFKSKDIIYDDNERADSLYIILNGKVAFYRKSTEYFDSDEVIFLNPGSCFGKFY